MVLNGTELPAYGKWQTVHGVRLFTKVGAFSFSGLSANGFVFIPIYKYAFELLFVFQSV